MYCQNLNNISQANRFTRSAMVLCSQMGQIEICDTAMIIDRVNFTFSQLQYGHKFGAGKMPPPGT